MSAFVGLKGEVIASRTYGYTCTHKPNKGVNYMVILKVTDALKMVQIACTCK